MTPESKAWRILSVITLLAVLLVPGVRVPGASAEQAETGSAVKARKKPPPSGIHQFKGGAALRARGIGDCPQAGVADGEAPEDPVETISDDGDDVRANQDLSCMPQNETSIAVNPRNSLNLVGGANDYRLGFGTSGFYASKDGGRTWRDGIIPFPSLPNGDNLDGGGDPAIAFDRQGYAYYAGINFNRTDDTNGVFVSRSSNGGYTWSRPCVPIDDTPANQGDNRGRCGGTGDPRRPGDGVLNFYFDNNTAADGSVPFNDKEYIAVGPRPAGVAPQCFGAFTRTRVACPAGTVGSDRIYVTWSLFNTFATAATANVNIVMSYSDDRGVSWSPVKSISGAAPFCVPFPSPAQGNRCNLNQFSVPTVHPATGALYVAFENFNTPDENQYLVVRSKNGGLSFTSPRFVGSVYDVNYPYAGSDPTQDPGNRPDCNRRGQFGRNVLTNSCFRVISAGNIVVDKRGGSYANDLYLVLSDNRLGTPRRSNTDVFLFKSTNGGDNWTSATRVNNDRSRLTGERDNPNNAQVAGNDQWFPWVDINKSGDLNVVFHDRRLDVNSTRHEWPTLSRQFPGNYLAWFWGAHCRVGPVADDQQDDQQGITSGPCVVDERLLAQPTRPVNPGPGPVRGQYQARFPFRNFAISDVPSNMDYSFRAGLFMGDYNNVAVKDGKAYGFWTDARNGRSSRGQTGRNPLCEQSDVWGERYPASGTRSDTGARATDSLFLKTRCP